MISGFLVEIYDLELRFRTGNSYDFFSPKISSFLIYTYARRHLLGLK